MSRSWPELPERYDLALRMAVNQVHAQFHPVGIFAAGSILRGQGGPTSDIDLYVLHSEPFRQRLQRRYNGVPFEIFINPPHQVRRYFEEEHREARQITAHMLATGVVVLDLDPVVQTLRNEAAQWLATPPNPSPVAMRWRKYLIADLLDNAYDVVQSDQAMADLILHRVLDQLIEYRFLAANANLPRLKDTLQALAVLDRPAAEVIAEALSAGDAVQRLAHVTAAVASIAQVTGYFEWDADPEPLAAD